MPYNLTTSAPTRPGASPAARPRSQSNADPHRAAARAAATGRRRRSTAAAVLAPAAAAAVVALAVLADPAWDSGNRGATAAGDPARAALVVAPGAPT